MRQRAARACARAVATLVIAGHVPARRVEPRGDMRVAPDVLAEPMYQQHGAAGIGHRPVAQVQPQTIAGRERRDRGRRAGPRRVVHMAASVGTCCACAGANAAPAVVPRPLSRAAVSSA